MSMFSIPLAPPHGRSLVNEKERPPIGLPDKLRDRLVAMLGVGFYVFDVSCWLR